MTYLPDPDRQPHFYSGVPGKRFAAWIVDAIVIFAICALLVLLSGLAGLLVWPLLYLTVGFVYRYVTLTNGSATWGMRFAGIELRGQDGARFDGGRAFLHTAGYTVSVAFPILQVISTAMMLTTPRAQGLTDSLLGTVAMNRRAALTN